MSRSASSGDAERWKSCTSILVGIRCVLQYDYLRGIRPAHDAHIDDTVYGKGGPCEASDPPDVTPPFCHDNDTSHSLTGAKTVDCVTTLGLRSRQPFYTKEWTEDISGHAIGGEIEKDTSTPQKQFHSYDKRRDGA